MADLAPTPNRRDWFAILLLLAVLAVVPPIAEAVGQPFAIKVASRVVVFAIAAVGLNLVLGFGGMVSLLHAGLFGVGGYVIGILAWHDFNGEALHLGPIAYAGTGNLLISLPLAVLVSAGAAALMGVVSLRTNGAYFIMITLAFNQMLYYLGVALQKYGGEDGLQIQGDLSLAGLDPSKRLVYFYVSLAALAVVMVLVQRLVGSRFGMVLRATAQNERRVKALGIPPTRYRLTAFALSGGIAGLAGALMASGQQFISPADMSWVRSGDLVVMCVLGGLTTVWGPVLGAALFLLLELGLSSLTNAWQLPFGLIVIGMAVWLHDGLIGAIRRWVQS
ncbi:MAG: branched-chain amino acid ABC transporter permease [Acetobacteraceae bacterium]|nr:branched-chain amino acid ABC transporter permease [Acetobacteraceae bacterium]